MSVGAVKDVEVYVAKGATNGAIAKSIAETEFVGYTVTTTESKTEKDATLTFTANVAGNTDDDFDVEIDSCGYTELNVGEAKKTAVQESTANTAGKVEFTVKNDVANGTANVVGTLNITVTIGKGENAKTFNKGIAIKAYSTAASIAQAIAEAIENSSDTSTAF